MDNKQEKFTKGMLVTLNEEQKNKYIIIESLKKDGKEYMLLTDFNGNIENNVVKNLKVDYSKCFMVCYDEKTGEVEYNHDENIIKLLVEKSLNYTNNN